MLNKVKANTQVKRVCMCPRVRMRVCARVPVRIPVLVSVLQAIGGAGPIGCWPVTLARHK